MDKNDYKSAIDSVKFSESFERDVMELMRRAAEGNTQKESNQMNVHKPIRTAVMIAALVAVLALSTFALSKLLSPKEVASQAGDIALSEAFDSKDAILIDQSAEAGDYTIMLAGIVSGEGLTDYCQEAVKDKSYIVASVAYTDGRKIAGAGETGYLFLHWCPAISLGRSMHGR
jgi:hypothetical protein